MTSVVVVGVLGFIIFGGVKRIAHVTQVVVPFMALGYILMAVGIILYRITDVPAIFVLIVSDAFSPMAGVGAAIGWGVKRGIYSNEAGQGSGPHAAAAAEINSPAFTQLALESVMGGFGKTFVAVALFFFAFTTLLAYYYIAETNVAYIRRTIHLPGLLRLLKIVTLASVFYGTIRQAGLAWAMGDLGVGLMAWLNIIGILILFFMGRPALKALKDYESQRKAGVTEYTFDPQKLGIKNAHFWEK